MRIAFGANASIPPMNPAANLVFIGPMGAGKTSIGRRVAAHLGLDFVDADQWLEARVGVSIATIFDLEGEAGFRRRESAALRELCHGEGRLIATGGGSVLDAGNRRLLRERAFVVWLRTSVALQLERLARDRSRPLLASGDRRQKLLDLAAERDPLYADTADLVFDTEARKPASVAQQLATQLAERWQRAEAA